MAADLGFDGDGRVTTSIGNFEDIITSIAIQDDGKIVAAGLSYNFNLSDIYITPIFALARYNTDGSLDVGFHDDGKLITPFGPSSVANSVAIQNDGKTVSAG